MDSLNQVYEIMETHNFFQIEYYQVNWIKYSISFTLFINLLNMFISDNNYL